MSTAGTAAVLNPFNNRAAEGIGQDVPEFRRASGECVCKECGKIYYKHPYAMNYLDFQGEPYLNKLCNGDLVKL